MWLISNYEVLFNGSSFCEAFQGYYNDENKSFIIDFLQGATVVRTCTVGLSI